MEKIDEYLCIDHLPSFQTLSNIACRFKIPIVKVQKYVEWKQSLETTLTMFQRTFWPLLMMPKSSFKGAMS